MTARRRRAALPARGAAPELDVPAVRRIAIDLLARKAWSRRELTRRLGRRGASAEQAQTVVEDLASRGYLDEESLARWWAESRAQRRRVGSVRLRRELTAKGIAPDLVAAAVGAAFERSPEDERAMEAGRRKLAALARTRRDRAPARLADYLLRRGYPAPVVSRVVKALLAVNLDAGATGSSHDGSV